MNLTHVKLVNGDDLVCVLDDNGVDYVVQDAVQIQIDPNHGMFAKAWSMLSEGRMIMLPKKHVMYHAVASAKAVSYYEEFISRIAVDTEQQEDDWNISELEDIFTSMMEAKDSTKH